MAAHAAQLWMCEGWPNAYSFLTCYTQNVHVGTKDNAVAHFVLLVPERSLYVQHLYRETLIHTWMLSRCRSRIVPCYIVMKEDAGMRLLSILYACPVLLAYWHKYTYLYRLFGFGHCYPYIRSGKCTCAFLNSMLWCFWALCYKLRVSLVILVCGPLSLEWKNYTNYWIAIHSLRAYRCIPLFFVP